MSLSPTSGVSADFTPAPIDDADQAYLLRLLFAEPAPEPSPPAPSTCGLEAAFDRIDRHLAQFQAEAGAASRPQLLLIGGAR